MALAVPLAAAELERALALYQRTDYQASLRLLLADRNPKPAELSLIGKNYFQIGDFKKSSEHFERATAAEPRNAHYHHWLGKAFGRRAESSSFLTAPRYASRCRQAFEKAVDLDPSNVEAISDLFEYYLEAPGILGGGEDKAVALAKRIAALDPAQHHFAQARLAEKRKQPREAEEQLRQAVEKAPRQVGRLLDLAKFLARQGRLQESEAIFRQAEQVAPDHPQLLFARAGVYVESKTNLATARELLRRYLEAPLTPDDPPRQQAEKLLRQASGG